MNTTWLLTGLPGSPKRGTPFQVPNSGGPPGRSLIFQNTGSPSSSISLRTRSHCPMLTPPLVNIASQLSAAESSDSRRPSRLSWTESKRTASPPIFSIIEARPKEFDSYISPSVRLSPGWTSSSPVLITAILGGETTSSSPWPMVAARDISAGPICMPVCKAMCPSMRFSPLRRMKLGRALPRIRTVPSCSSESSIMTMASAPSGIGAPVIILHASPEDTGGEVAPPG